MSAIDVGRDSIQRRIVREFFATTGLVLFLTASALSLTAFVQFQTATDENLIAMARIIGRNSEASLLFDDQNAATETLRALEAEESIEAAIVYDHDGAIFAKYIRSDVPDFQPRRGDGFEPRWSRDHIELRGRR